MYKTFPACSEFIENLVCNQVLQKLHGPFCLTAYKPFHRISELYFPVRHNLSQHTVNLAEIKLLHHLILGLFLSPVLLQISCRLCPDAKPGYNKEEDTQYSSHLAPPTPKTSGLSTKAPEVSAY